MKNKDCSNQMYVSIESDGYQIPSQAAQQQQQQQQQHQAAISSNKKPEPLGLPQGGSDKAQGNTTKRRSWKKPKDKPKRSLTSYNIFFQYERARIISGRTADASPEEVIRDIEGILSCKNKEKRRHRKTHGRIGFQDLARSIAEKWKTIDPQIKAIFVYYADLDTHRYRKEVKLWKEKKDKEQEAGNLSSRDTNDKGDANSAFARSTSSISAPTDLSVGTGSSHSNISYDVPDRHPEDDSSGKRPGLEQSSWLYESATSLSSSADDIDSGHPVKLSPSPKNLRTLVGQHQQLQQQLQKLQQLQLQQQQQQQRLKQIDGGMKKPPGAAGVGQFDTAKPASMGSHPDESYARNMPQHGNMALNFTMPNNQTASGLVPSKMASNSAAMLPGMASGSIQQNSFNQNFSSGTPQNLMQSNSVSTNMTVPQQFRFYNQLPRNNPNDIAALAQTNCFERNNQNQVNTQQFQGNMDFLANNGGDLGSNNWQRTSL